MLLVKKLKKCEVSESSILPCTQNRKLWYLGKRSLTSSFDSCCNLIFRNDKNELRQKLCPVPKIEKSEILERFLSLQIFTVVVTCSKFVYSRDRSTRQEVFCKKGAIGNFAKLTGKHLCQSFFFNKVAGLQQLY